MARQCPVGLGNCEYTIEVDLLCVRRFARVRGVMGTSAMGLAVTIVPAMAIGGGCGEEALKRGWMIPSMEVSREVALNFLFRWLLVGREKLGGLDGGDEVVTTRDGEELQSPSAVAVSEDMACGGDDCSRSVSTASSGDSGLLPGIVSKPCRTTGEEPTAARIS